MSFVGIHFEVVGERYKALEVGVQPFADGAHRACFVVPVAAAVVVHVAFVAFEGVATVGVFEELGPMLDEFRHSIGA